MRHVGDFLRSWEELHPEIARYAESDEPHAREIEYGDQDEEPEDAYLRVREENEEGAEHGGDGAAGADGGVS